MRKKVYVRAFLLFVLTSVVSFSLNVALKGTNVRLSDISISNIEILAQTEGNPTDCPGGWCSTNGVFSNCTACCPAGKKPECTFYDCQCIPR